MRPACSTSATWAKSTSPARTPWPSSSTSRPTTPARLSPGMVQYTGLMTAKGTYVDDMLVYCVHPEFFLLVVNAANTDKDFAYVQSVKGGYDVALDNASRPLQPARPPGPAGHPDPAAPDRRGPGRDAFLHLRLRQGGRQGVPRLADGLHGRGRVRDLHPRSRARPIIWDAIMEKGTPLGLKPVGLGARDTLRLEAKLPLYGNDIDDTTTPLECRLQVDRQVQEGRFPGARRPRRDRTSRASPASSSASSSSTGASPGRTTPSSSTARRRPGRFGHVLAAAAEEHRPRLPADRQDRGRHRVRNRHPDKRVKAVVVPTPFYKARYI